MSYWQKTNIGLDNDLAPNRWQAIIWTNTDPIHWRIDAALVGKWVNTLHYFYQQRNEQRIVHNCSMLHSSKVSNSNHSKVSQLRSMGVWLPNFVVIAWVVHNFQRRQAKIPIASVAAWPWPRRNRPMSSITEKTMVYMTYLRTKVEYASKTYDLHTKRNIEKVEMPPKKSTLGIGKGRTKTQNWNRDTDVRCSRMALTWATLSRQPTDYAL